ncbi:hypothetical protein L6R52_08390 [Myxococcota bacterium]|nr:hypothetical protein [Myxococcota bacterium]
MASVKLSDVDRAARLLKQVADRADINKDGAIRAGDLNAIRAHEARHAGPNVDRTELSPTGHAIAGLNAAVGRAKSRGGPQLERVHEAIDDFKRLARAGDRDGNRVLSEVEQRRLPTAGEKNFMQFVVWAKGKTMRDIDLPPQRDPARPRFDWRGTPAEVCQSLLAAHTRTGNDNFWPSWGGTNPGPSRYVITTTEAREMVAALEPMSARRQKAVLTALAARTESSEFGCVSPTDAAKRVLETYAASLGLALDLGQPSAPLMPGP